MTITQLHNYLFMIVEQHRRATLSYPSLKYYHFGGRDEIQRNVPTAAFNPKASTGRQYPAMLFVPPDGTLYPEIEGSKLELDCDFYFCDTDGYDNNSVTGTAKAKRSAPEVYSDLLRTANDVLIALRTLANEDETLEVFDAASQPTFSFLSEQTTDRTYELRMSVRMIMTLPCPEFVFDSSDTGVYPFPATGNDYEKIQ